MIEPDIRYKKKASQMHIWHPKKPLSRRTQPRISILKIEKSVLFCRVKINQQSTKINLFWAQNSFRIAFWPEKSSVQIGFSSSFQSNGAVLN